MARSSEAFWWSLFAAGGVVSAFLTPVTVVLIGIALPAGWITADGLYELVRHPLTRLYLVVLISLSLFHGNHRTLLTLMDLGLKAIRGPLAVLLYGIAIIGTVLAIWLAIQL